MVLSALTVNCAACHGLLEWTYQQYIAKPNLEAISTTGIDENCTPLQAEFINQLASWAMECLGTNLNDQDLWAGWQDPQPNQKDNRSLQIGSLCRIGPDLINSKQDFNNSRDIAAMYRCYQNALLKPWRPTSDDIDAYVDSRKQDISLSSLVYKIHFADKLREAIDSLLQEPSATKEVVIVDIGAGSGEMLADAAAYLEHKGQRVTAIAVEPSSAAREACIESLKSLQSRDTHVFDGTIENPENFKEQLNLRGISDDNLIIMAKAALHDRGITTEIKPHDRDNHKKTTGPIYRDQSWQIVSEEAVIADMTFVLNRWRETFRQASQIIMETHILPKKVIRESSDKLVLMPAYIAHSLSAQYLLRWTGHAQGINQTTYLNKQVRPLCKVNDSHPLMSISTLTN